MFDFKTTKKYWLEHAKHLSEEEIIKIFEEDFATKPQYEKEMDEWIKHTQVKYPKITPEERLLAYIYGEDFIDEETRREIKRQDRLKEIKLAKYPMPKKHHLSKENQKRVVEGSMHLVFEMVEYYYLLFDQKIKEETLYYLFLEKLMDVAKYMVHCGDPVFRFYVIESFHKRITKYIAYIEKITYQEALEVVDYYEYKLNKDKYFLHFYHEPKEIHVKDEKIEYYRPSELNFIMRNIKADDKVSLNLEEKDFYNEYLDILSKLPNEERQVMSLSYTEDGYRGLTYDEIAETLGMDRNNVLYYKKNALAYVRKELKNRNY